MNSITPSVKVDNLTISKDSLQKLQVVANAVMQYAVSRFKVGSFTRDLSAASGTQAVTGVGFSPKAVLFFGTEGTMYTIGFSNIIAKGANAIFGTVPIYDGITKAIYLIPSSGNSQQGDVSSLDADGFTINWVKLGTPTGTATINYLAFR